MSEPKPPSRVAIFVDGFNLYFSLTKRDPRSSIRPYISYRWLNIESLCKNFISNSAEIVKIYYFTALYPGNSNKDKTEERIRKDIEAKNRHRLYINALESTGNITTVLGNFLEKQTHCPLCRRDYLSHEEKLTDVNIAIGLIRSCILDHHDTALVVSGDNDLVPAYKQAKELFPSKALKIILPISSKADHLKSWARESNVEVHSITKNMLETSQFPDSFTDSSGRRFIKPRKWQV